MTQQWYAIRTFPGYEYKVQEKIEKRIQKDKLEDMIEQIFIPTYKKYTFVRKNLKLKEELIFPGYVFIKMNLTNELMYTIRGVQYVTGYAGINETKKFPDPVEEHEVAKMVEQTKNVIIDLSKGESILVNDGIDVEEAVIESINLEKETMDVFVKDGIKTITFSEVEKYKAKRKTN